MARSWSCSLRGSCHTQPLSKEGAQRRVEISFFVTKMSFHLMLQKMLSIEIILLFCIFSILFCDYYCEKQKGFAISVIVAFCTRRSVCSVPRYREPCRRKGSRSAPRFPYRCPICPYMTGDWERYGKDRPCPSRKRYRGIRC